MAIFANQTGNFLRGEIGARVIGGRNAELFFAGFLQSDEVMHYGLGFTKRPPLRFVAPFQNSAEIDQLKNYFFPLPYPQSGPGDMLVRDATGLFFLDNGYLVLDDVTDKIKKVVGEGDRIKINTENSLLLKDKNLPYGVGGQVLDFIFIEEEVAGTPKDYYVTAAMGEKKPFLSEDYIVYANGIIPSPSNVPAADTTYSDYTVLSDRSLFVNEDITKGFDIDPAGQIKSPIELLPAFNSSLGGSSITSVNNSIISAVGNAGSVDFTIFIYGPQPTQKAIRLSPTYGSSVFWIRGISRGLLFATDKGIFLSVLADNSELFDALVNVTQDPPSNVNPVLFRDFVFYVDGSGLTITYIRFDRFKANAIAESIGGIADLLPKGDKIKKMIKARYQDSFFLLCLSEKGEVVVGSLAVTNEGLGGSMAFSRWFVDYQVKDLIAPERGQEDVVYLIMRRKGSETNAYFIASFTLEDVPLFRSRKETRRPSVDLYTYIDVERMLLAASFDADKKEKPVIFGRFTDSGSASIATREDFFIDLMVGYRFKQFPIELEISRVTDSKNAVAFVVSGYETNVPFVLKDYQIAINSILGLSYLNYLQFGGATLLASVDDYEEVVPDSRDTENLITLNKGAVFASCVHVGTRYTLRVITAPLATTTVLVSAKNDTQVFYELVGWREAALYVRLFTNSGTDTDPFFVKPVRQNIFDEPNNFIKHYEEVLPHFATSKLMLEFISDSVVPPFVSALGVKCQDTPL